MPGKAVAATVEGRRVAVGSPRHAAEEGSGGLSAVPAGRAEALEAEGKTATVVLVDSHARGLMP